MSQYSVAMSFLSFIWRRERLVASLMILFRTILPHVPFLLMPMAYFIHFLCAPLLMEIMQNAKYRPISIHHYVKHFFPSVSNWHVISLLQLPEICAEKSSYSISSLFFLLTKERYLDFKIILYNFYVDLMAYIKELCSVVVFDIH